MSNSEMIATSTAITSGFSAFVIPKIWMLKDAIVTDSSTEVLASRMLGWDV